MGVQGGVGVVLVRYFFRFVVRVRFFGLLELLLAPFWGGPEAVNVGAFWGMSSGLRFFWGLWMLSSCAMKSPTWPGGLRAARFESAAPWGNA